MEQKLEQYQEQIAKALDRLNLNGKPANLYEPGKYIIALGGKRMRPLLTLLGCELFGGEVNKATSAALAMEVFHNFSLIHDDIMDKAPIRRGKPTVHIRWNETIAILSGDLLLVKAYELLSQLEPHPLKKVLEVFNDMAIKVCEGQQMDMDFEQETEVEVKDYIQMITYKTAVLLGCSLQTGAIIAGADDGNAELLYDYGVNMGIAFQLMDDVLDVFGDEQTGKQSGGDILADKKTYLLLRTREKASVQERQILNKWLGVQNDPLKVTEIKTLMQKLEVDKEAQLLAEEYFFKAYRLLEAIPIEKKRKETLNFYADWLKSRVS